MVRLLLIVLYVLGGAGSGEQSSSLIDLHFTQRPLDTYQVFCAPQIPEERIFQVHWKEEHANGSYSVIAVLNPQWGNYTKFSHREEVKLHKKDGAYTMEIMALKICICCEIITTPSGSIHENCITFDGDSDVFSFQYAMLASLLVGGFFLLGSIVLICHICWMRKRSRRVLNLRGATQHLLTRGQRSQVPYRRTSPSVNLAYEPPHDTDLRSGTPPPAQAHLQRTHATIHLPPQDLPPGNPMLNNRWNPEEPCPTLPNVTPRSHVLPVPHPIYTNVLHRNKRPPKRNLQAEPTMNQHQREVFSYEGTASSLPHYHTTSRPWLFEDTSYPPDTYSSRVDVPRTPESPFTTINPMYHTGTGWASHPKNSHQTMNIL